MMGQVHNWSVNVLFPWNHASLHQLTFKYVVINLCRHMACEFMFHIILEFWCSLIAGCYLKNSPKQMSRVQDFQSFKNKLRIHIPLMHGQADSLEQTNGTAVPRQSALHISEAKLTMISRSSRPVSFRRMDPHGPDFCQSSAFHSLSAAVLHSVSNGCRPQTFPA